MGRRLTSLLSDLAEGAREKRMYDLAADLDRFVAADKTWSGFDTTADCRLADRIIQAFGEARP